MPKISKSSTKKTKVKVKKTITAIKKPSKVIKKVVTIEKKEKTTIILVSHGPMIHGSWFTPIPALPKLMLRMVEFQSASTLENFTASSGS